MNISRAPEALFGKGENERETNIPTPIIFTSIIPTCGVKRKWHEDGKREVRVEEEENRLIFFYLVIPKLFSLNIRFDPSSLCQGGSHYG